MKSIIIVPTYNEAENLETLAMQIFEHLPAAHLMVMDDNSPDGTADIAERMFAIEPRYANYRVVRRTGRRGLGRAYRDGFERALEDNFDFIIQMDADLSHDPAFLPSILAAAERADLVIGSRYCPGGGVQNWPNRRIWLSRFACWYVRKVARIPVMDATGGYRCWSRRALESVHLASLKSEGYSFQVEMTHRALAAGMVILEEPIVFTDRTFGRSKISRTVLAESFVMPWKLRRRPWRPMDSSALQVASGAAGRTAKVK